MQRRFYYLTDNLNATVEMARAFEARGIPHGQIHVLAKNETGLVRHNIKTGTPLDVYDIVHLGWEGAIIGTLIGFLAAIGLWLWNPFGYHLEFWMVLPLWVLFTLHGAWAGGLIGTHARNYRIKPFLKAIESGKFLTLVDVDENQAKALKQVEAVYNVKSRGHTPTGTNPFENWLSFRASQSDWPDVKR